MTLTNYRTLGRSGLIVSPLTLGTMTFGTKRWGADEEGSRAVFDAYVDAGGNSIDTADVYSSGRSEELLGRFIADRGLRDRVVLATKAGFPTLRDSPHVGGNSSKTIQTAIEASLRRLRTDVIDLYWIHLWDMVTPAEEVLQTLGNLVRAGKIRYFGLSNIPAWYVAKMATLAGVHGVPAPIALQLEYSLVERTIEQEHLPAAREFGLGVLPWSPLAGGFLTGKYRREDRGDAAPMTVELPTAVSDDGGRGASAEGRLSGSNPFGDTKFTDRNWAILDALRAVAQDIGRSPAQVALAWALKRPGITSLLIGASRAEQVADNVASLDILLSPEQAETLDRASAQATAYPYAIFSPFVNRMVFGGSNVQGWRN